MMTVRRGTGLACWTPESQLAGRSSRMTQILVGDNWSSFMVTERNHEGAPPFCVAFPRNVQN
jgi:hypothetical protein